MGGWAANGRPVIQCLFDCNSLSGLLAGAIVLNPEVDAGCVAAPLACVAAGLILIGAFLLISALRHPTPPTWGPNIAQARGQHQSDLPIPGKATGPNVYIPATRKGGSGQPVWGKNRFGTEGWIDAKGNVWVWDTLHKDHWDVEHPDRSHTNVWPDGRPKK